MPQNALNTISIIVHGGAGMLPAERYERAQEGCRAAAAAGWEVLRAGGHALDAVEAAVRVLEDDPAFNAGRGSVLNAAGQVEMDAGIMDGHTGQAGAVTLIKHVRHPITLARYVMTHTPHLILGAEGAEAMASKAGCEWVENAFFITPYRLKQYRRRVASSQGDTVGAVALDAQGHLAAANSTGGVSFKYPGRIGDSPIPGAGYVANSQMAAAATGQGEHIILAGLAFLLRDLVASGLSAPQAASRATALFLQRVPQGQAGWILLDAQGRVGIAHTTQHLPHAWRTSHVPDFVVGLKVAGGR